MNLNETNFHVMIDEETVNKRIVELGEEISRDYAGKELVLVCILRGSVIFMAELAKRITIPCTLEFMWVSSYGNAQKSSGEIRTLLDLNADITGKDVLIVEDIIDTGRTLYYLKKELKERGPNSVGIVTLLDKPQMRVAPVVIEYTGFVIEDKFVVGYGLDYAQKYRNLPYVAYVE